MPCIFAFSASWSQAATEIELGSEALRVLKLDGLLSVGDAISFTNGQELVIFTHTASTDPSICTLSQGTNRCRGIRLVQVRWMLIRSRSPRHRRC